MESMDMKTKIGSIDLPLTLFKRGKVRDVFEVDNQLLIVSTDRISAFDYVLPSLIPDKGKVLNQLSAFWFRYTKDFIPNHVVCDEPEKLETLKAFAPIIEKRAILTRKLTTYPIEAIVRGYIVGSGWKTYQRTGEICGVQLPPGLNFADKFPEPIFTPTTKADDGHDENLTFEQMENIVGKTDSQKIRELSISLFKKVSQDAYEKGIIIADTKFEYGKDEKGNIILIDEIFTPDSSRFWKVEDYSPGKEPPAFDKQYVRNYLSQSSWDKNSPPPELPNDVIARTREKYLEIYEILTGNPL
ncbi:MAG: phosphoribosylaminoimidazolesuccinocarboxamide synthase [Candidatus Aminicenantes bacterium]|nr:phosphoribosylaminoimidazolesuccinocarboxamide synthase [Candidatus Aminicenantes bacterium]NIM84488.1 phosphoribosylaminoimidazolesuccinocarboxamide synthase [Candidatus Aminicenantes bacterium]NIN24009.1 phosphoribosylaminoimidazolesuccinocarboxamide synthase [Candidatus Aminicenantes bacterium]NIN47723.1 phosphoribosylaminoimidazolesuccinocarboxamide synthase [Candidatus Aminicenantes bacterium]NIN90653.1 phosphoribosylaminoimidazolesuccinocarboxamide synthase [Candidatus Aminicenantes ba